MVIVRLPVVLNLNLDTFRFAAVCIDQPGAVLAHHQQRRRLLNLHDARHRVHDGPRTQTHRVDALC